MVLAETNGRYGEKSGVVQAVYESARPHKRRLPGVGPAVDTSESDCEVGESRAWLQQGHISEVLVVADNGPDLSCGHATGWWKSAHLETPLYIKEKK